MKLSEIRFALVEDRSDAIDDIMAVLKTTGLSLGRCVGQWAALDSARSGLDAKWREIDLLLLDLNIPLTTNDPNPTKDHGRSILDFIVNDLNRRGPHKISVVIVSGEVQQEYEQKLWLGNYKAIVVGLATKGQLTTTLPDILRTYCEDPYTAQIRAHWPAAESSFHTIIDENQDTERRSLACQTLACLMLRNIAQFELKLLDQSTVAGVQLKDLLADYLARNFNPISSSSPKIYPVLKKLKGPAEAWVWRGYLVEYLWTINNFRNGFIHVSDTGPFNDGAGSYGIWKDSTDQIKRLEEGHRMCQILSLLIKDLLDWYLPWHRKVYVPWVKTLGATPTPPTK